MNIFEKEILWIPCKTDEFIYESLFCNDFYQIKLNDFPDEILYTLFKNNQEMHSFNNWPEKWKKTSN